jgi:hypothetical protein
MIVDQFKREILPGLILALGELFLLVGDIHATLYIGNKPLFI